MSRGEQRIIDRFHTWYYQNDERTWKNTTWLGVPVQKNPCDLFVYSELITTVRPEFIIECGTLYGGSALFLATICEAVCPYTQVITIDREVQAHRPRHHGITYLQGDTMNGDILAEVAQRVNGAACLVILDDDHTAPHVLDELRAYSGFVTPGSYLICEDGNIGGHPVWPEFGAGPSEAIQRWFLEDDPPFEVDRRCEKHGLTFNPSGYLRRTDG